jgi:hypothetical protein
MMMVVVVVVVVMMMMMMMMMMMTTTRTWGWRLSKHPLEMRILTHPMCNKYILEWRTAVLCLAKPRDGDNPQINCSCINKNRPFHTVSLYLDKDSL